MNLRPLFLAGLLTVAISCPAQEEIKQYVLHNTIPVAAIDPDSTDYSDLAAFGEAVGGSRIVMLGEQDHGDAATFLAKTRLIKCRFQEIQWNSA